MKKVHILQGAGGLLISALGLYIFFKNVNTTVLWKEICTTDIWIIAAVVLLNPLTIWFRSMRWRVMLPQKGADRKKNGLFRITLIGFMVNNLLPARIGEAARAVLLWKRNGFTIAESIGSLVLERSIDLLTFSAFFFIPVFGKNSLSKLQPYASFLVVFFLTAIIALFIYSRFTGLAKAIAIRVLAILPLSIKTRTEKIGSELVSNLEWTFSLHKTLQVIVYSALIMFSNAMMLYFLAWGLGTFDVIDSMFGVAMAALGAAIPLSPGYIGTLHSSLLQGLAMVGVLENKAGAMAVLYHAIGYVTITILGLLSLVSMKMTFKEISKAKDELKKE